MGASSSLLQRVGLRNNQSRANSVDSSVVAIGTAITADHSFAFQNNAQVEIISHESHVNVYNHVVSNDAGEVVAERLILETLNAQESTPLQIQLPPHGSYLPSPQPSVAHSVASSDHEDGDRKLSVPYTPQGEEADVFKYYCPLCMQYFKLMWKTNCCTNYICYPCIQEYLKAKGIVDVHKSDELRNNIKLHNISCPHCQSKGFHPMSVSVQEIVRDYSTRNEPTIPSSYLPSPLRIGESFEDLKRKMIPFRVLTMSKSQQMKEPVTGIAIAETPRGIAEKDHITIATPAEELENRIIRRPSHDDKSEHGVDPCDEDGLDLDESTERLLSNIRNNQTPAAEKPHRRPLADDELSETADMLEESFESTILFSRLDTTQPTMTMNQQSEYFSRQFASLMIHNVLETAITHMQVAQ